MTAHRKKQVLLKDFAHFADGRVHFALIVVLAAWAFGGIEPVSDLDGGRSIRREGPFSAIRRVPVQCPHFNTGENMDWFIEQKRTLSAEQA